MFPGDELIPRLSLLNRVIDAAYCEAAGSVGFSCEHCDGVTCCTVDLKLHTLIEMLYLRRGVSALDKSTHHAVLDKSHAIVAAKLDDAGGEAYRNSVCALNIGGRCAAYDYRPMICRLAGIPHYFVRPDGETIESGGCTRYLADIEAVHPDVRIDRTEFYREMASIEVEIIRLRGRRSAPRTIAETLTLSDRELS